MSKGGGGDNNTTTVQKADPWIGQQPFLRAGYAQAQRNLQGGGPQPFPDQTFTPFSGETELGLQTMWDRARLGSPVQNEARGLTQNTLQGDFLNQNPWIDAMYQRAADQTSPYINAAFGGAGRTGSEAHQRALTTGLNDLATSIYGQNYENERGRQMQALAFAPGL